MPPASTARQQPLVVTVLVAALAAVATVWAHWLNPLMNVGIVAATGVALAALLVLEPRHWPLPIVATGVSVAGVGLLYGLDFEAAAAPAVAAVVGSVVGACCLRVYARGHFTLRRVADVAALAVLGAGAGAFVGAAAGVAVAKLGPASGDYWTLASRLGAADALGVLIASTLLLSWATRPNPPLPGGSTEGFVLGVAVLAAGWLAFHEWDDPLAYATLLLLVWAAIRFRVRGVSTAALAVVAIADWSIARGAGPLVEIGQSTVATVLILQTFAAVSLLALLFLAAALDERDIADAHRRLASDQFRRTFDLAPVGMALTTLDREIVDANPALCEMLGTPRRELIGTDLEARRYTSDGSGEHDLSQFSNGSTGQFLASEQRYLAANGEIVWVEVTDSRVRGLDGNPDSRIVLLHDITRRKGLEEQLLHAQKMEAVGRLAGDVAHDFNNLLAVMRGHAELLDDDLRVLGQARTRLASMQRATAKAAALTEDLLAYSRRRTDEPEVIDLHEVITAAHEMLLQLVGDSVVIDLRLDASNTSVHADPNRIEQVLVNLVVNAIDAMPSGGTLTIATSNPSSQVRPGPWVALAVTDTGIGMTPAVRRRIFEPFFTTKPPGSGTGLGLSTASEVVRHCGGIMSVESEPGNGTTFVIILPVAAIPVDAEEPDSAATGSIDLRPETILVVDDELDVRTVAIDMLRRSGYQVLEAADARGALELIATSDHAVGLVLSDVVMPGTGGPELADQIRTCSPDTQIVFVSGYADIAPTSPALRGATLLRKPLERDALLAEVEAALDLRSQRIKARSGTPHRGR